MRRPWAPLWAMAEIGAPSPLELRRLAKIISDRDVARGVSAEDPVESRRIGGRAFNGVATFLAFGVGPARVLPPQAARSSSPPAVNAARAAPAPIRRMNSR